MFDDRFLHCHTAPAHASTARIRAMARRILEEDVTAYEDAEEVYADMIHAMNRLHDDDRKVLRAMIRGREGA